MWVFVFFSLAKLLSILVYPLTFFVLNKFYSVNWLFSLDRVIYTGGGGGGQMDVWMSKSYNFIGFLVGFSKFATYFLKLITNYAWKRTFCKFATLENLAAVYWCLNKKNSCFFWFEIQKWILIWKLYSFLWSDGECVVVVVVFWILASAVFVCYFSVRHSIAHSYSFEFQLAVRSSA